MKLPQADSSEYHWPIYAGIGLLFAGGYYFSFTAGSRFYLLATARPWGILNAAMVLWIVAGVGALVLSRMINALPSMKARQVANALFIAGLVAICLRGYLRAAGGYSWISIGVKLVGFRPESFGSTLWFVAPILLPFAWFIFSPRTQVGSTRFLSAAGWAMLALAMVRGTLDPAGWWLSPALDPGAAHRPTVEQNARGDSIPGRRVIWFVLDEFDPEVAFGGDTDDAPRLGNFRRLLSKSIVGQNVHAPSNSTIASIPAMLIGTETRGNRYEGPGRLKVIRSDGAEISFESSTSVFGRIPGGERAVSILGFYHPYCHIFVNTECVSLTLKASTPWYDGLQDVIPKAVFNPEDRMGADLMYDITRRQIEMLPRFVGDKGRALTFIHLNVPHLPAQFAAHYFNVSEPANNADAYRLNLRLTDDLLGRALVAIEENSSQQELLLILSSDHWLRARDATRSHPSLFVVNLARDPRGVVLDGNMQSHHLADLAVQYLSGKLGSHAEIAEWYISRSGMPQRPEK